jgi:hypothetical protein
MTTREVRSVGSIAGWGTADAMGIAVDCDGEDDRCPSADLMEICRPEGLVDIANLGLTLPEAKRVLASVQRATPDLDQLQAHLSALMTYRVAADVLQHLLPIDAGLSPETLRHRTLRIGEQLRTAISDQPTAAAAITVSMDSTSRRG